MLTICGCTTPSQRYDRTAHDLGLARDTLDAARYTHIIWRNDAAVVPAPTLHVYLESDGLPYTAGVPAADPTPRQPLALRLLAADTQAAVLVSRPCYHGLAKRDGCDDSLWTDARYSEAVVESLATAIDVLRHSYRADTVVLIGYSGGGTLAALVAPRLSVPTRLVTIGANLDTAAWANARGFVPLHASLNPADSMPSAGVISELHFVGAVDRVVPAATRQRYFDRHPHAHQHVVDDFGHACCWVEQWPALLRQALSPAPR